MVAIFLLCNFFFFFSSPFNHQFFFLIFFFQNKTLTAVEGALGAEVTSSSCGGTGQWQYKVERSDTISATDVRFFLIKGKARLPNFLLFEV